MAISQKYAGKMLVAWFNANEWKYVMDLIYDEHTPAQHQSALDILRMWKTRTAQLPQGVEGTLIILEAIMQDVNNLSDENLRLLYGTSIMRFLNLCGANAEKQGTFYKTAIKHKLPRWLIELRHDIAHNQTVPSKYLLELGLKFCLDWLRKEYWNKQRETLTDLFVIDDSSAITDEHEFRLVIDLYCQTKLTIYQNKNIHILGDLRDSNDTIIDHMSFVGTILGFNPSLKIDELLNLLLNMMEKQFCYGNKKIVGEILSDVLVTNRYLLNTDIFISRNGYEKIPLKFINLWAELFELLYNENSLISLIKRLLIWGDLQTEQQLIASIWLNDLFIYLNKLKKKQKNKEEGNPFVYKPRKGDMRFENLIPLEDLIGELKTLAINVLQNPHELYLKFLISLLQIAGYETNSIEKYESLIRKFTVVEEHHDDSIDQFYTLDDLPESIVSRVTLNKSSQESNEFVESEKETMDVEEKDTSNVEIIDEEILPGSRWKRVKNPQVFAGHPLGVLPNQQVSFNPLLQIY